MTNCPAFYWRWNRQHFSAVEGTTTLEEMYNAYILVLCDGWMAAKNPEQVILHDKAWQSWWWRATNYLAACQLFLQDNVLLQEPLRPEHIKPRLLGHWGTCPGLNLLYIQLLRIARNHKWHTLFIPGPGHGAPSVLANVWLEGSYGKYRPEMTRDAIGLRRLCREFSTPGGVPSHVGPHIPGAIHEGGELGYGLLHAYGAAFDRPDLFVMAVVGDGEAETGPASGAWKSLHYLNPIRDGAVLPVLHLNGYRIAAPTVFGRTSDREIMHHFGGLGYRVFIVNCNDPARIHGLLSRTMDTIITEVKNIQTAWRSGSTTTRTTPAWPLLVLRTPKGWTGPHLVDGLLVEGTYRSHQVPLPQARESPEQLAQLESWLLSYRPHDLFDRTGHPHKRLLSGVPDEFYLPGNVPDADGGRRSIDLRLPDVESIAPSVLQPGAGPAEATRVLGKWLRDVLKANDNTNNFRIFCPDELVSNRLEAVFEVTNRCTLQPIDSNDDHLSPEGRVFEVLSEHCCEGWLEGYVLTGRHGLFACYEAFAPIVDSMINQHAKWLKTADQVSWRRPLPSLNILLTSHTWRQDHNGYSHQGPGFIDNILNRRHRYVRAYLPPDANTLLAITRHALASRHRINLIISGKQPMPLWLNIDDAVRHAAEGLGRWSWAEGAGAEHPAFVLACAGDVPTLEVLAAADLLRKQIPDLPFRLVNVTNLLTLATPDEHPDGIPNSLFEEIFTADRPVLFAFHGYPHVITGLVGNRSRPERFHVQGYQEEGTTTTPFDMVVANRMSRYHLLLQGLDLASWGNKEAEDLRAMCQKALNDHQLYITTHFEDLPEVRSWHWSQS